MAKSCLAGANPLAVLPDDSEICNDILRSSPYVAVFVCIQVWDLSLSLLCCRHSFQSLGCVVLQTFGICGVCRRLGCAVLQTAKGFVLTGIILSTGFPVQTFSANLA